MIGEAEKLNLNQGAISTIIDHRAISKITTYQVQEMELKQLDSIVSRENTAAAFATFCLGVLISTITGWMEAETMSANSLAFHKVSVAASALLAVFFVIGWWRARKERPALLELIRENTRRAPDQKGAEILPISGR